MYTRVAVACVITLLVCCCSFDAARAATLLVPVYYWPQFNGTQVMGSWGALTWPQQADVSVIYIINPNSGPSNPCTDSSMSQYMSAVKQLYNNGNKNKKLVGYVLTSGPSGKASRPASAVKADIDRYYTWYAQCGIQLDGIYLDDTPIDANSAWLSQFADYRNYVKGKGFKSNLVITNPGCAPTNSAQWAWTSSTQADIVQIHEVDYTDNDFYNTMVHQSQSQGAQLAACFLGVPAQSKMEEIVATLPSKYGIRFMYVTEEYGPPQNPYLNAPVYWNDETVKAYAAK